MSDPHYNSVSLLLHANADPFVDSSPTPKVVSKFNGAALSTTAMKFGAGSLDLTTPGYISVPTSGEFTFGTDFTIEAWINTYANGSYQPIISSWGETSEKKSFYLGILASGLLVYESTAGNSYLEAHTAIMDGTWLHVAVSFSGGFGRLYVNGISYSNPNAVVIGSAAATTNPIEIGTHRSNLNPGAPTFFFNGFIDDVRVTNGVGRYTGTAYTVPSAQFNDFFTPENAADLTLPMLTLEGGFGADVMAELPILTFAGGGGGDFSGVLAALGIEADFGAGAEMTIPILTVDALSFPTARADLTLPMLTFGGSGHDATGENSLTAVLPRLTFQADFGASATVMLPMLAMDAAAVVAGVLALGATLPALTLDAGGWGQPYAVTADITLPMITLRADFGADVALVLPMLLADAAGTAGGLGTVDAVLPMLTLHAVVTAQTYGWADLTLPMLEPVPIIFLDAVLPMLTLGAEAAEVLVAAYEAYAVNLNHSGDNTIDEVTRYTNFPFTHIVRYQNSYFGVAADGLYLLEGTTDHATPAPAAIPWKLKTHVTDFGNPMLKTPVSVYVGGRLGQTETFTLYAGETSGTAHVYTNPRGATAQNYRQKLGRGVKARYFAVGLQGDGAAEIDNLEFDLNTLTRRI